MNLPFWLYLVAGALGTYRVGYMVSREKGPFELFQWLRDRFIGNNWVAEGIRCFYCVSFWIALPYTLLLAVRGLIGPVDILFIWPGLAASAIVIHKYWLRE